ncbi:hypothetical protein [Iningainema tapete]|uniref:Uncharacterized protein n=1 Tax=Iningainema tapete BLCC-T55 TaxID=2748662 RepID=A0A8J7BZU5_9CYAN|nr:hypothetical protein [Iningainema tapete]MBD2778457.1 hypothetical protein [Iningainema tapete BLCC-T55]
MIIILVGVLPEPISGINWQQSDAVLLVEAPYHYLPLPLLLATEVVKLGIDPISTHSYTLRTNITKALAAIATNN